jgi:hypothetical protein
MVISMSASSCHGEAQEDPLLPAFRDLPKQALPNAFLVGAMKCGTSWLAQELGRHPEVFLPTIKEPNLLVSAKGEGFELKGALPTNQLFAKMHRFSAGTVEEYRALYAEGETARIRIDASVRYLVSDLAAARIASTFEMLAVPARIVIMLRDPVERIWSHWQMHRTMGIEPLGLSAALAAESSRMAAGWSDDWAYAGYSSYDQHLSRYLDLFGRDNVHVEVYEEAIANPSAALARVFAFLGLDPRQVLRGVGLAAVRAKKRTGSSQVEQLQEYWRPTWRKAVPRPLRRATWQLLELINGRLGERQMPLRDRAALTEVFRPVVSGTEDLLNRPLPWTGGRI